MKRSERDSTQKWAKIVKKKGGGTTSEKETLVEGNISKQKREPEQVHGNGTLQKHKTKI